MTASQQRRGRVAAEVSSAHDRVFDDKQPGHALIDLADSHDHPTGDPRTLASSGLSPLLVSVGERNGQVLSALGNYTPERHESGILPRTFQAASASRLIGRPLMRLSRHYRLGRSQPTLDFVDVDTVVDTPVFISPKALACFSSSPQNLRQRIGSKCSLSALSLITACWSQRLRSASRVVQIDGRGSAI